MFLLSEIELALHLSGKDVRRYLHGRLTQDIKSMTVGNSKKSLLLNPQGKVQGKFTVICAGANDFILLSNAKQTETEAANMIADLLQFKVADDVTTIEIISDQLHEEIRLIIGEPAMGHELTDKTIATDIDVTDYLSFNKGCYTGQETVEMSTARGRPNRALVHFSTEGEAELTVDTEIKLASAAEEKSIGKVTSSLFIPYLKKTFGLGFVKYDHRTEKQFRVNDVEVTGIGG